MPWICIPSWKRANRLHLLSIQRLQHWWKVCRRKNLCSSASSITFMRCTQWVKKWLHTSRCTNCTSLLILMMGLVHTTVYSLNGTSTLHQSIISSWECIFRIFKVGLTPTWAMISCSCYIIHFTWLYFIHLFYFKSACLSTQVQCEWILCAS